jgi:hypothetical protein
MALDIILLFQFGFISFLPYFRFQLVLPILWVSSGKIGEAVQVT